MNLQKLPMLSIVIVTYKRKDILQENLDYIEKFCFEPIEVIVVDNHSVDGTKEMVEEFYPWVKYVELAKNMGAPAWNQAVQLSSAEWLLICDDDCVLYPPSPSVLIDLAKRYQLDVLGIPICHHRRESQKKPFLSRGTLLQFSGASVLINALAYRKLHGYNPSIFLYYNEIDFTIRGLQEGMRIGFTPIFQGQHNSDAVGMMTSAKANLGSASLVYVAFRYFNGRYLLRTLLVAIINRLWSIRKCPQYLVHTIKGLMRGLILAIRDKSMVIDRPIQHLYAQHYLDFIPFLVLWLQKLTFRNGLDRFYQLHETYYPEANANFECRVISYINGRIIVEEFSKNGSISNC